MPAWQPSPEELLDARWVLQQTLRRFDTTFRLSTDIVRHGYEQHVSMQDEGFASQQAACQQLGLLDDVWSARKQAQTEAATRLRIGRNGMAAYLRIKLGQPFDAETLFDNLSPHRATTDVVEKIPDPVRAWSASAFQDWLLEAQAAERLSERPFFRQGGPRLLPQLQSAAEGAPADLAEVRDELVWLTSLPAIERSRPAASLPSTNAPDAAEVVSPELAPKAKQSMALKQSIPGFAAELGFLALTAKVDPAFAWGCCASGALCVDAFFTKGRRPIVFWAASKVRQLTQRKRTQGVEIGRGQGWSIQAFPLNDAAPELEMERAMELSSEPTLAEQARVGGPAGLYDRLVALEVRGISKSLMAYAMVLDTLHERLHGVNGNPRFFSVDALKEEGRSEDYIKAVAGYGSALLLNQLLPEAQRYRAAFVISAYTDKKGRFTTNDRSREVRLREDTACGALLLHMSHQAEPRLVAQTWQRALGPLDALLQKPTSDRPRADLVYRSVLEATSPLRLAIDDALTGSVDAKDALTAAETVIGRAEYQALGRSSNGTDQSLRVESPPFGP